MIGSKFLLSTVLLLGSSTIISSLAQERFVPDQLLVKFKSGTPRVLVHEVNTEIGAFIIGTSLGDPDLYLVQVRPGLSLENAINRYQMNPNVVRASKNLLTFLFENFGDNFGDIAEGSRFFSEGRAYLPWAVGQNARCDLLVRRFGVGPERDVEALFFGRAGDAGSNWSLGSYRNKAFDYLFQPNRVSLGVTTRDGSAFSGKTGRIGVGFIGRTGGTTTICPLTGLPYDEDSFAASVVAGVQLDDRRPFWHTDPPYTERTYAPIAIGDLTQMTISMNLTAQSLTMDIFDSRRQIFTVTEPLPVWNWSGTRTPIFAYYGVAKGTSGALYLRGLGVYLP